MTTDTPTPWEQADLVRRLGRALDTAADVMTTIVGRDDLMASTDGAALELMADKVVAETAMLLLCAAPVQGVDTRVREAIEQIVALLLPLARGDSVRAAICLDPGLARDHAVAHLALSRLGYPDEGVDRLLAASLASVPNLGPERLPHRELEQEWLARLHDLRADVGAGGIAAPDGSVSARSALGRPLDALAATRFDLYAFTHAVMYESDLGERTAVVCRPPVAIAADAEAALAHSLDLEDFDLTAEVLLSWPMLGLPWSPAAAFAFRLLTEIEDEIGFLPGTGGELARYREASGGVPIAQVPIASYHTAYVMGFLCAAVLREGCAPPTSVPAETGPGGAAAAVQGLLGFDDSPSRWKAAFDRLSPSQQDSVAPLLLGIALRRARPLGDVGLLRQALTVALAHDLLDAPAPRQAAALLRRCAVLTQMSTSPVTDDRVRLHVRA